MSPNLRVLVVDDEPLGRERIRGLLADEADVEIVAECRNGEEAVAAIRGRAADAVFLDIQMPGLSGLDVVREVGVREMPVTVFVTAFDEHAVRAFEAHALDYLLKPFDRERFQDTLSRVRAAVRSRRAAELDGRLERLLRAADPEAPGYAERFTVRSGPRLVLVPVEEVEWIAADGNYARLHTRERSYLLRETMTRLEARLDPGAFVRIHRSAIVRISCIAELESVFQGEYLVVLRDGTRLSSSRPYRERLERAVGIE